MLQPMGLQRVGYDLVTEQQQQNVCPVVWLLGHMVVLGFPGGTSGTEPTCQCSRHTSLGRFAPWVRKVPWRRECILAWRIPWTEEPGGLQCMGLQRVGHDWATNTHITQGCHRLQTSQKLCGPGRSWAPPWGVGRTWPDKETELYKGMRK